MPPDIVSIQKNFNGATIATVNKPTKSGGSGSGGSSNDYIKKIDFQRFIFSTPALVHRVEHNKNTTQFIESIFSEDGDKMFARIDIVDENVFDIHLTESLPCRVDALFGIEYTVQSG